MRASYLKLILILLSLILVSPHAHAAIEWTLKKQLKLEAAPMDVASSLDGKWLFVLASGEVMVYSIPEYKVVNHIPVDKMFDRVTYSAPNNTLIVSSSTEKTVKIIQLEFIHHFSLENLPFQGAKNAPVTLVVFSDYQ